MIKWDWDTAARPGDTHMYQLSNTPQNRKRCLVSLVRRSVEQMVSLWHRRNIITSQIMEKLYDNIVRWPRYSMWMCYMKGNGACKGKSWSHLSQTLIRNKGGTSWKFAFQNDGTRSSAKLLFNENARWKLDVGRGRTAPCMTKAPRHVPGGYCQDRGPSSPSSQS